MGTQLSEIHEYLRWRKRFPTVWCAGCGDGTIMGAILRAIHDLQMPQDSIAFISGIGCSSRMPIYLDFNTLHTTHGRALPFATGVKLVRPDMNVIVVSGDGDALAIGGNHFIHTCRRNIDITMVLINNSIYGMTGGQVAPTTPIGAIAHTMPYGNIDPPFDAVELSLAAGATFVARSTTYNIIQTTNYIKKALQHKGFSFVEIISQCPVLYGRLNGMPDPVDMLLWQKEVAVPLSKAKKMSPEELEGKITTGIFRDEIRPEYTEQVYALSEKLQEKSED
ncbi:2-oxoacid:ferredoxin oxidoreductase subunit beta [bacterium]|nr:2-oxoacid:ferredoxin oxidoreductase subunit beta [bacterium]